MSSPRVLFLAPAEGGPADVARKLVPHVRARGWEVSELTLSRNAGAALLTAARAWARTRGARARADIVHVELGKLDLPCFWYALLAGLSGNRVTLTAHDAPGVVLHPAAGLLAQRTRAAKIVTYRLLAPLLDRLLVRALLARVKVAVVLSPEVIGPWRAAGAPKRIVSVPHGADGRGPQGAPSEGSAVLTAGFLGPSKGLDLLIDAWEIVGAKSPLPLWIMGDTTGEAHSPWIAALKRRSETMANPPVWLGHASEVEWRSRIQAAAIVVLPYRTSNPASGPLVSAVVEGRAIVMSDVMAARGVLVDEDNALVTAPGDVPALAEALDRVIHDLALRDRLGRRAGETGAARFSWSAHADGLLDALAGALD
jgi:glycosyltransferase involved in cell wall biosynthesis